MKIIYRGQKMGIGFYIKIEVEILDQLQETSYEQVDKNIFVAFSDQIPALFREGVAYIKQAIIDYRDQFSAQSDGLIIFNFQNIESNPAHYLVESFYGATISIINEHFGLNIKTPDFMYDTSLHKIVFDLR